jgi:uncharacterized protein YegL
MKSIKDCTLPNARALPVIILADTSGSMETDGKIEAMNTALREMIRTFGMQSRMRAEIWLSIITFGETTKIHSELKPAHQYEEIPSFIASGGTPFGQALNLTQQIIEDKNNFPSGSYYPTIVVITDGMPTDAWEPALESLLASETASRATRLAMGVGPDKDDKVLVKFINNPEIPVISGKDARDIEKFLRCVSMSVTQRSVQANPNKISHQEIKDLFEEEELDC